MTTRFSLLLLLLLVLLLAAALASTTTAVASSSSVTTLDAGGAVLAQQALDSERLLLQPAPELWLQSAALGNETAQYVVGVMHAWGLHGLAKDERKAILHLYFSALGGHVPAQMALAYRHSRGDGVPMNCNTAAMYGELASNQLVDRFSRQRLVEPAYTADRVLAADEPKMDSKYNDEDLVEYYLNLASKGDHSAMGALGKIYFYGAREVERDLARSFKLLSKAAQEGDVPAMASLGHLLLLGESVSQEAALGAWGNFTKAAAAGNLAAINGLGYMHLFGYDGVVPRDGKKAIQHFTKATETAATGAGAAAAAAATAAHAHVPEAFYNLGAIHASGLMEEQAGGGGAQTVIVARDFAKAFRYFTLAAQKGSVLGLHKLAHMSLHGLGTAKSCKVAVQYFKSVAERTRFALEARHEFARAFATLGGSTRGATAAASSASGSSNLHLAYEQYLRLAEMGYELGEVNAARVLDMITSTALLLPAPAPLIDDDAALPPPPAADSTTTSTTPALLGVLHSVLDAFRVSHPPLHAAPEAFRLYERAAEQGNTRARLRVGDFWYYTQGDLHEAALQYRIASEGANAQAHFNLGYQHHHGLGLVKDLHLAKWYYDLAYEASPDSKLAVSISLALLWWESVQRAWTGENLVTTASSTTTTTEGDAGDALSWWSWPHMPTVSLDTVMIALLVVAFFGVGIYRDRRLARIHLERHQ